MLAPRLEKTVACKSMSINFVGRRLSRYRRLNWRNRLDLLNHGLHVLVLVVARVKLLKVDRAVGVVLRFVVVQRLVDVVR